MIDFFFPLFFRKNSRVTGIFKKQRHSRNGMRWFPDTFLFSTLLGNDTHAGIGHRRVRVTVISVVSYEEHRRIVTSSFHLFPRRTSFDGAASIIPSAKSNNNIINSLLFKNHPHYLTFFFLLILGLLFDFDPFQFCFKISFPPNIYIYIYYIQS